MSKDMKNEWFLQKNDAIYVRPTNKKPDFYISTKYIEDHKEQFSKVFIDDKELVRCKDCEYFMDGNGCHLLGADYTWEEQMGADDFCSRGEKKCGK